MAQLPCGMADDRRQPVYRKPRLSATLAVPLARGLFQRSPRLATLAAVAGLFGRHAKRNPLFGDALLKTRQIDQRAHVRAFANGLHTVMRADLEGEPAPIDIH